MRKNIFTLLVLLLASSLVFSLTPVNAENSSVIPSNSTTQSSTKTSSNTTQKTKKYLIKLKKNIDYKGFIEKKNFKIKKPKKFKLFNTFVVKLTSDEYAELKNDSSVEFVENDSTVNATDVDSSQNIPWGIRTVGANKAQETGAVGEGIKIAILDTGIAPHEDLVVKDGVSFVEGNSSFSDDQGHGTHVAGTIGALNNNIGVVGVAPGADIFSVKVLDKNGAGSYSQIIEGVEWAIENKMNIINMSLGGTVDSKAFHEVIQKANNAGIIIIAAAGNSGQGTEKETFPARYSEVLSIGAIDSVQKRAIFSSTGKELDLVAPGVNILSTKMSGDYGFMSGTSMAAPHVTGIAASLWSKNKQLTSNQIKDKLVSSAVSLGAKEEYGNGIANISNALGLTTSKHSNNSLPNVQGNEYENILASFKTDLAYLLKLEQIANENNELKTVQNISNAYHQIKIEQNKLLTVLNKNLDKESISIGTLKNEYVISNYDSFLKLINYSNQQVENYVNLLNVPLQNLASIINDELSIVPELTLAGSTEVDTIRNNPTKVTFKPNITGVFNIYSQNVTSGGEQLSFTDPLEGTNPSGNVSIEVFANTDFTGKIFDLNNPSSTSLNSTFVKLYANKTYYLKVSTTSFTRVKVLLNAILSQEPKQLLIDNYDNFSITKDDNKLYKYTFTENGEYKLSTSYFDQVSSNGVKDTAITVFSDNKFLNEISYNNDANGSKFSEIIINGNVGDTIYIQVTTTEQNINASISISKGKPQIIPLTLNNSTSSNFMDGGMGLFSFTPTQTGIFRFYTSNANGFQNDTVLFLYSNSEMTNLIVQNDDYKSTKLSQINYRLTAGTTYYLMVKGYANSAVNGSVGVSLGNLYYYDIDNKLDYIILFDGRKLDYVYDDNGNLIRKVIVN